MTTIGPTATSSQISKGAFSKLPRSSTKTHAAKTRYSTRASLTRMRQWQAALPAGSLTVLHPDGTEGSFSPIYGKGISGPWAVSVDGNGNIWVSNFTSAAAGIVHLCGFRTENCPPGMKTGDAISPPGEKQAKAKPSPNQAREVYNLPCAADFLSAAAF